MRRTGAWVASVGQIRSTYQGYRSVPSYSASPFDWAKRPIVDSPTLSKMGDTNSGHGIDFVTSFPYRKG
jgi:hypothetical protein